MISLRTTGPDWARQSLTGLRDRRWFGPALAATQSCCKGCCSWIFWNKGAADGGQAMEGIDVKAPRRQKVCRRLTLRF